MEKLRAALGGELVAVVLYGSGAVGDRHAKFSDYNILCVLSQITPAQLRATEPLFRWWREQGNPAPLLLTETELRTATDCFPIEFHDIREHNQVLFGPDLVSGMSIDDSFYRAQVEHDLRAKLLRLRQKASAILRIKIAAPPPDRLGFHVLCAFSPCAETEGRRCAGEKREIVKIASEAFSSIRSLLSSCSLKRREDEGERYRARAFAGGLYP